MKGKSLAPEDQGLWDYMVLGGMLKWWRRGGLNYIDKPLIYIDCFSKKLIYTVINTVKFFYRGSFLLVVERFGSVPHLGAEQG